MKNFILVFIILLAFILRFFKIDSIPPSLTWDEVAWGYNAYSLGIDLKDEFGRFLPLAYLESFGDFKPPLYAYLSILPVKIFGLGEFATRFTSAFFGVATVFLTYFLTKNIFHTDKKSKPSHDVSILALLSTGILALSPWHLLLSRAAFEANVATFFIVLGVVLFLYGWKHNKWLLIASFVSFVLSMYTFNTARIVAPILMSVLILSKRSQILTNSKYLIPSLIISGLIAIPLALFLLTPQSKLRFHEVNIFTDASIIERSNRQIEHDNNAWWSNIIHNRRVGYTFSFVNHFFDNLSPSFLFVRGDGNPKFSIQDVGQMYLWEVPFFIAGIFILFRKKEGYWWLIPVWLFVSILPAATARETPHALRIESALPTFQILTAYGLYYVVSSIKYYIFGIKLRQVAICITIIAVVFNFLYFIHNYFVHYPTEFSGEWQYGYKEAVEYANKNKDNYQKIFITEELGRPYIYTLFYSQYDPLAFRRNHTAEREVYGFAHVKAFDKYHFEKDLRTVSSEPNTLYIDIPSRIPPDAKTLQEFKLLNGQTVLVAYTK